MSLAPSLPGWIWSWRWRSIGLALALWLLPGCGAADPRPTAGEYSLKAAFLLNFTKFVEWPASAFSNASAPFILGVAGEDLFGAALDAAFTGQTVAGHPIALRRYHAEAIPNDCHLLFVSRSEKERQPTLLADLQNRSILTVGETDQFLEVGGTINLFIAKERVRFEVNRAVAERVGLKLSSKLLAVAARVLPGKSDK